MDLLAPGQTSLFGSSIIGLLVTKVNGLRGNMVLIVLGPVLENIWVDSRVASLFSDFVDTNVSGPYFLFSLFSCVGMI